MSFPAPLFCRGFLVGDSRCDTLSVAAAGASSSSSLPARATEGDINLANAARMSESLLLLVSLRWRLLPPPPPLPLLLSRTGSVEASAVGRSFRFFEEVDFSCKDENDETEDEDLDDGDADMFDDDDSLGCIRFVRSDFFGPNKRKPYDSASSVGSVEAEPPRLSDDVCAGAACGVTFDDKLEALFDFLSARFLLLFLLAN